MGSSVEDENYQLIFPFDKGRMEQVMNAYDQLSPKMRKFIQNLDFSLHDDHVLQGENEVRRVRIYLMNGGQITYKEGNGQN